MGTTASAIFQEGFDQSVELLNAPGLFGSQIRGFADVLAKVVELVGVLSAFAFMEDADQLPVALMYGNGRWHVIGNTRGVGEKREDGAVRKCCIGLSTKSGQDTDPVENLSRFRFASQCLEHA